MGYFWNSAVTIARLSTFANTFLLSMGQVVGFEYELMESSAAAAADHHSSLTI